MARPLSELVPPTSTHAAETFSSSALIAGEQLERRLEELLHQDRFAPPRSFVAAERVNDASLHARAELDPNGFWAEQARELHWDKPFTTVLDDSNPPFYKWFTDGELNVSYNCLDRHVEAGAVTASRSTGPARRASSARSPTPSCTATCRGSRTRSRSSASARATSSGSTCR